jgi:alkanesulfonate monooxygenase SsuD/methylene tetrahydromethanopterin reductase-like flavin-dependent oxidoreductase (luciferase family)
VTTLDQLTRGRAILGVGGGLWPEEFQAFGDEGDRKTRAAMLDEALDLLNFLWSGEPVQYQGTFYRAETTPFAPPFQRPRVPIWIAATWPVQKMLKRAARWDGVYPLTSSGLPLTPDETKKLAKVLASYRRDAELFDIVCQGHTKGDGGTSDAAIVDAYEAAGGTWWMEMYYPWDASIDEIASRIRRGPPRGTSRNS